MLYLLIETSNIQIDELLLNNIVESKNELAKIILIRKGLLKQEKIAQVSCNGFSWILIYELYVADYINEEVLISKLNLNKNLHMYQYLKQNNVHFCE